MGSYQPLDEDLDSFLQRQRQRRVGPSGMADPQQEMAARAAQGVEIAPPSVKPGVDLPGIGPKLKHGPQFATDTAELDRLKGSQAGVDQIGNPVLRGMAKVADIASTALFPRLATAIPGTTLHYRQLLKDAQGRVDSDLANEQSQQKIDLEAAQGHRADAAAAREERAANSDKAIHTYTNKDNQVVTIFQKPDGSTYESGGGFAQEKPPTEDELALRAARGDKTAEAALKRLADQKKAGRAVTINPGERQDEKDAHTRIPTEELSTINASLPEGQTAYPVGTTYGDLKGKGIVPKSRQAVKGQTVNLSKVEDRAALAENVKENAQLMRDIMERRPELFGGPFSGPGGKGIDLTRPLGGRSSDVQEALGTNDPDILAWERAKSNLGKANVGMHNMRSKYALEQDENTYHFKHGVEGIGGSLDALESSANQFVHEFDKGGPGGSGQGPARPANVPEGYVHQKNGPKGSGWYRPTAK
jgi:hypothetical protein